MRPRERRESGEQDLFRSRLDQIIAMSHPLVRLAKAINWRFLEKQFGAVYTDGAGRPPLPTRLMAGLAILKHTYNLSDEAVCALWVENPYYQYFCGEEIPRAARFTRAVGCVPPRSGCSDRARATTACRHGPSDADAPQASCA